MSRIAAGMFVVCACVVAGCDVVSLNPIFNPENVVIDKRIYGSWEGRTGQPWLSNNMMSLVIAKDPSILGEHPTLVIKFFADRDWIQFGGVLLKIDETFYLDMMVGSNVEDRADSLKLHPRTFMMVSFREDQIRLYKIDREKFEAVLKEDPSSLLTAQVEYKRVILSESPAIQKFLQKHKDQIFDKPLVFERIATKK